MTRANVIVKGCCEEAINCMSKHEFWLDFDSRFNKESYLYMFLNNNFLYENDKGIEKDVKVKDITKVTRIKFCPFCGTEIEIKIVDNKDFKPLK